jgi:hypothetical protein
MAKMCEVCGKAPGVRKPGQPRPQRLQPSLDAESAERPRDGRLGGEADAGLHPLHPLRLDQESGALGFMEDRPPRLSSTILLARSLSIAGHPFILIPLMIAAATGNRVWTAVVAACTILPMFAITVRNVRRGTWSDHDVSRPDERGGLYRVAFPLVALSAVVLYFLGAGPQMMRGFAAAAVMLALGLLGSRWLKISMHMMAAFCGVIMLARIYPTSAFCDRSASSRRSRWSRWKLETAHRSPRSSLEFCFGFAAAICV